jgi:hypothetical protein
MPSYLSTIDRLDHVTEADPREHGWQPLGQVVEEEFERFADLGHIKTNRVGTVCRCVVVGPVHEVIEAKHLDLGLACGRNNESQAEFPRLIDLQSKATELE